MKKEIDKDKYLKKIKIAKRGSIKRRPIKIEKSVSESESVWQLTTIGTLYY